jgi:hypothetical protein
MSGCADTRGHLSLPCSLRDQANQLGHFLLAPSFDTAPVLFLRLFTTLLGEFNGILRDVAALMEFAIGNTPRTTTIWADCWSKHALAMLVQHHPRYLFADEMGTDWAIYLRDPTKLTLTASDGECGTAEVIDTNWLCENGTCADLSKANFSRPVVVIVPPLADLLQETVAYYGLLVDKALGDPCRIRKFEGQHHHGLLFRLEGGRFTYLQ